MNRQPPQDSAADDIAEGMFPVSVIEGVIDGDADFGAILPECVSSSKVEQGVTVHSWIWDGGGRNDEGQGGKGGYGSLLFSFGMRGE